MSKHVPFAPSYQLRPPYDKALIPNLESFNLWMIKEDGSELEGTVRRGTDGLHYVADCLGNHVPLPEYVGWRHR
jgi:hypothetical protein